MRFFRAELFYVLAVSAVLSACEQKANFVGRVVGITDGDTVTVLTATRENVRVRLGEIDAPERGQPYGDRARQALSDLLFGRDVHMRYQDTDQYGRIVARLYVDDVDVSARMVELGAAWVYRDYARDRQLFSLEDEARRHQRGLWALSENARVEPWEWRQGLRGPEPRQGPQFAQEPFSCGTKRTCGEMTSCAEASFYLDQCRVTSLDGDQDGIPCEAICE